MENMEKKREKNRKIWKKIVNRERKYRRKAS
jgi:hypothetical protein